MRLVPLTVSTARRETVEVVGRKGVCYRDAAVLGRIHEINASHKEERPDMLVVCAVSPARG